VDYFSVQYYTNCVSLKLICASIIVRLCIFKIKTINKFGQLILRKIIKIVATRCQILMLKLIQSISG